MIRLGVIGAGQRASQMLATMHRVDAEVRVAAVADPDAPAARNSLIKNGAPADDAVYHSTADDLLAHADRLDGIVLGTRCNLHTPLAIKVAPTGLPLFLEKPVAVNTEQLRALRQAFVGRERSVVVSFPLRVTPLFQKVLAVVRSGHLGTINHVFAYNFVNYGGVYFGEWYRDFPTTGGLWLQKATHDFDYINQIVDAAPTFVAATETRNIYGGDHPEALRCSACDRTEICPESPINLTRRGDGGGMNTEDHWCAFSESIQHHDAASALIGYADGTHASYSQNFVTRRSAHWRGSRITGYLATLEFDWADDTLRIIEHHGKAVEETKVVVAEGHNGGDAELSRNFLAVVRGEGSSKSTLADGLLSAEMCLAARASAENGRFQALATQPGAFEASRT